MSTEIKLTNNKKLPLSVAVWLAHDTYDYIHKPEYFSATEILRPVKQIVLSRRSERIPEDIADLIASRIGNATHDAIERAWRESYKEALKNLNYSDKIIDRIIVNPSDEELEERHDAIPVYMELRGKRKLGKFIIGGKFDFLADGGLEDFKTTKTYTWIYGTNDEQYIQQASIYRWIHHKIVTKDTFKIVFIFTDWLKSKAQIPGQNYPSQQILSKVFPLMSLEDTEAMIMDKLNTVDRLKDAPEEELPVCTDDDLWRKASKWKYYADPNKAKDPSNKSTKNFDNVEDAYTWLADKGKGAVIEQKGQVKRCEYCPAFENCKQKDEYLKDGTLIITD